MKIWICIPVFNRIEHTLKCLESLQKQTYSNYCVVVCDHGSTDGTSEKIRLKYPDVVVLPESSDLWWTGAINCCIQYVLNNGELSKDSVVTLNNDLVVDADYLEALASAIKRYPKAIVSSAAYDCDRQLVAPGVRLNWLTSKVKSLDPLKDRLAGEEDLAKVTHAPGRGTLIPLRTFKELGLYDQQHLPHYGADYDFTFRASRAGYLILISYRAKVINQVEATGMTVLQREFSLKALRRYLTDIRSPANLHARLWLAINNCPRLLLPSFLVLDLMFVIGSYFKVHLIKKIASRE